MEVKPEKYSTLYSHIHVLVCVMFSPSFMMKWHRKSQLQSYICTTLLTATFDSNFTCLKNGQILYFFMNLLKENSSKIASFDCSALVCSAKHEWDNFYEQSLKCLEIYKKRFSLLQQLIIIAFMSIKVRFKLYFENSKIKHHMHQQVQAVLDVQRIKCMKLCLQRLIEERDALKATNEELTCTQLQKGGSQHVHHSITTICIQYAT